MTTPRERIFKEGDKWWHWDESYTRKFGPFYTFYDAERAYFHYCDSL